MENKAHLKARRLLAAPALHDARHGHVALELGERGQDVSEKAVLRSGDRMRFVDQAQFHLGAVQFI